EDALQVVHGLAVIGHGTQVALGHDALHVVLGRRLEPHAVAGGKDALESGRLRNQAAARGQHKTRVSGDDVVEAAALQAPKSALAVKFEDHAQRNPGLLFDQPVKLEEWNVALLRQFRAERRFSCATQSDERDALVTSRLVHSAEVVQQQLARLQQFGGRQAPEEFRGVHQIDRRPRAVEQQDFQRNIEGARDVTQQQDGDIALSSLQLREVAFGDTGIAGQDLSSHAAAGPNLTDTVTEYPEEAVVVLAIVITFVITAKMAHRSVRMAGHRRHKTAAGNYGTCIILP